MGHLPLLAFAAAAGLLARGAVAQPLAAPAPSGARPTTAAFTAAFAPAPTRFAIRVDTTPAAVPPLAPATPPKPRLVWPWVAAGGAVLVGGTFAAALWQSRDDEMFIAPQVVVGIGAGAGALAGALVGGVVDLTRRAVWERRVREQNGGG